MALQLDGERDIVAGGKDDGASTGCCGCFDSLVDGGRVDRLAIARGPIGANVEERGRGWQGSALARCGSKGRK